MAPTAPSSRLPLLLFLSGRRGAWACQRQQPKEPLYIVYIVYIYMYICFERYLRVFMHSLGAQRFSCTFLGINSFNKLLLLGILLLLVLLLSGLLLLLLPFCSLIFIHVRIDWDSQRLARSVHTFAAWLARRQSCHSASAWQLQTKLWLQLGLSLILSLSLSLSLQSTVYSLSQSLPTCRWRIPATILGKCVGVGTATKSNWEPASSFNSFWGATKDVPHYQWWAGQDR